MENTAVNWESNGEMLENLENTEVNLVNIEEKTASTAVTMGSTVGR